MFLLTRKCIASAGMLSFMSTASLAAIELPATWIDSPNPGLGSILDEPLSLSDAALFWPEFNPTHFRKAIRDEDNLISRDFRIPPGMEEHVRFWMRIYTYYSSQTLILHDDHHPEVVYEVVDFRELATEKGNPVIYQVLRERKIKARVAAYREAFHRLIENPRQDKPSAEMRNIIQAISRSKHPHTLSEFADRIRGQTGQRDHVLRGLRRADRFMPAMEGIFESFDLPKELIRISLVESSFNTRAISKAGATGVWQFMFRSGKEFMTVAPEKGVDERLSPLKSTVAAAKLLRRNMRTFKSWPLAVTSYNYGLRVLSKIPLADRGYAKIGDSLTRCDRKFNLGFAGRNYYAEFLAFLYAEKYRKFFFPSLKESARPPVGLVYHKLKHKKSALKITQEHGISPLIFREINPDIRDMRAPLQRGFRYALPGDHTDVSALTGIRQRVVSTKPTRDSDT